MNKIIMGFVGDLAAGKGTVASYLQKKYHSNTYRFSTMLRDMLDRIYVEKSRENMQALSTFVRSQYGQDIMSRVIAEDVKKDPNDLVVVEGIRRPTDITFLQELPGFHLIYITADQKIRWQRAVLRNENLGDADKTFEQFCADEQAEADRLIVDLGKKAEDILNNDNDMEALYQNVEALLKKYGYTN